MNYVSLLACSVLCLMMLAPAPVLGVQDTGDDQGKMVGETTHIDWTPDRLIKFRVPKERENPEQSRYVQFLLWGIIQTAQYNEPDYSMHQVSLFKAPFFNLTFSPKIADLAEEVSNEETSDFPPYMWQFEKPLFSLYDFIHIDMDKKGDAPDTITDADFEDENIIIRTKFLDTLIFRGHSATHWGGDSKMKELLHAPFVKFYTGHETPNRKSIEFLDTTFLGAPVGHLWNYSNNRGEKSNSFLDIPFFTVFRKKASEKRGDREWGFLQLLSTKNLLGASLLQGERDDDGDGATQYLRLPLIGPVWANWQADGKKYALPFPRLFSWGRFKY